MKLINDRAGVGTQGRLIQDSVLPRAPRTANALSYTVGW